MSAKAVSMMVPRKLDRTITFGNVTATPHEPLSMSIVEDVPLDQPAWPRVVATLSVLAGLWGVLFLPPVSAMPCLAPNTIRASAAFPAWYPGFGLFLFLGMQALHLMVLVAGVSAARYRPGMFGWHIAYAVLAFLYVTVSATILSVVLVHMPLGILTPDQQMTIELAADKLVWTLAGELLYPLAICVWFAKANIRSQLRQWKADESMLTAQPSDV